MTLCYGICYKMLIMCILRVLPVTRIVMSTFAFVATGRFPYAWLSSAIPGLIIARFLRVPGRKAENSPLFLVGHEELAKPAFQMEELLLFYSFPCREPTVPRYAARWERSASSMVTLELPFFTRFANASLLESANIVKASLAFSH